MERGKLMVQAEFSVDDGRLGRTRRPVWADNYGPPYGTAGRNPIGSGFGAGLAFDDDESDDEEAVEATLGGDMMALDGEGQVMTFEPGAGQGRKRSRREADLGDWGLETEDGNTKQMISYDIYLKGNVSKQMSFFKSDGGQQQRFRMFPYVEKKRRVDEYGETVDVATWLRKGKALEEDAESEEVKEARRRKEEEEAKVSIYLARNDPVLKRSARKHPENHHRSSSSRSRRYSLHAACSLLTWKA